MEPTQTSETRVLEDTIDSHPESATTPPDKAPYSKKKLSWQYQQELREALSKDNPPVKLFKEACTSGGKKFLTRQIVSEAEVNAALEPLKTRYKFRTADRRLARLARIALARVLSDGSPRNVILAAIEIIKNEQFFKHGEFRAEQKSALKNITSKLKEIREKVT